MSWFARPREGLDQDLDHPTATEASAEIDFALVGRVIGGQGGFTALDHPLRPQDDVALEASAADGSRRLAVLRDQHPRAWASIGGAADAHHRRQRGPFASGLGLLKGFDD